MANTSVYTGADGSIQFAPVQGPEGDAAGSVIGSFDLATVGRVQNVAVQVQQEVRAYYELGGRGATALRSGNVSVRGSIGRAYINGALLRMLLGVAADQAQARGWPQPTFNITFMGQNGAVPGTTTTLTLHDVKLDGWALTVPEDDFMMESITFQARYLTVEDKTG